jgi:hypothetical protein
MCKEEFTRNLEFHLTCIALIPGDREQLRKTPETRVPSDRAGCDELRDVASNREGLRKTPGDCERRQVTRWVSRTTWLE